MDRTLVRPLALVGLLVSLPGCRSYEPRPLDPAVVIETVERERRDGPDESGGETVPEVARGAEAPTTFARAVAWMRRQGPEFKEALAAYRTALARARVPTPAPNPGLDIGGEYGSGDDAILNQLVPFGSIGFAIPLGGRLEAADQLNRAAAEVARIDGLARHRELYLDLRRRWVRLLVAREVEKARQDLVRAAEQTVLTSRRLVEAGRATALDISLFELERGRSLSESLDAAALAAEAEASLAVLTGVQPERFQAVSAEDLPVIPAAPPPPDELRRDILLNHPGLARLRARYEESERALRLEIARQYPDFRFGPSAAGETGEEKTILGLSLGIELPLFDRNQQAIAEAEERREEIRSRYEAEASRALAGLERARRAFDLAVQKHRLLCDTVLPRAREGVDLARRSVAAGAGDALRLLEAERSHRQVLVETLESGLAEKEAWVDLELAVGRPLVRFPSEGESDPERPPEGLKELP
jgi:outer membrane protein TolC